MVDKEVKEVKCCMCKDAVMVFEDVDKDEYFCSVTCYVNKKKKLRIMEQEFSYELGGPHKGKLIKK